MNSWRRQFFSDLAHGVKFVHLYQFATAFSSVAGDYVDADGGTYQAVLTAVNELGTFDDIIAAGKILPAKVALLFSETGDIWKDTFGTADAAKRALYIALKHTQLAVDVLTEPDLEDGTLNSYGVLYVANDHIRRSSASAIVSWVADGGTVVSCSGGGLRDEFNQTNPTMMQLFGLSSIESWTGIRGPLENRIDYIKQDLPFSEQLDTVHEPANDDHSIDVRGRKMIWKLLKQNDSSANNVNNLKESQSSLVSSSPPSVLLTYVSDETPAMFSRVVGKGNVFAIGFDIGLSYFTPAIPLRPVARGSNDSCFNHWIPTDFSILARQWAAVSPTSHMVSASPVITSEALVDVGVVSASNLGVVLPIINWTPNKLTNFSLTLQFDVVYKTAVLASGSALGKTKTPTGRWMFTFTLNVADAIILRL